MRLTMSVVSLFLTCAFLQPTAAAQGKKSSTAQNKVLAKKAYDWFNSNNWDSLATIIAADYIEHDPDQGQKPGFEGLKAQFQQYYATFPDMKMELKDIAAEGDKVMTRVIITKWEILRRMERRWMSRCWKSCGSMMEKWLSGGASSTR